MKILVLSAYHGNDPGRFYIVCVCCDNSDHPTVTEQPFDSLEAAVWYARLHAQISHSDAQVHA